MATKELTELVTLGLKTGELVGALSDGFQLLKDVGPIVAAAKAAGPGLKDAGKALDEYVNMTDAEAVELEAYVVANFDIADDSVEEAIEMAMRVVIQLRELAKLFIKPPAVVNPVGP